MNSDMTCSKLTYLLVLLVDDVYEEHEFGGGEDLGEIKIQMNESARNNNVDNTAPVNNVGMGSGSAP